MSLVTHLSLEDLWDNEMDFKSLYSYIDVRSDSVVRTSKQ